MPFKSNAKKRAYGKAYNKTYYVPHPRVYRNLAAEKKIREATEKRADYLADLYVRTGILLSF